MNTKKELAQVSAHEKTSEDEISIASPSRRAFFGAKSVVATVAAGAAIATPAVSQAALAEPGSNISNQLHVLNRLTFGYTPESYERIQSIGISAFIEEQLDWRSISDTDTNAIRSKFPRSSMTALEIMEGGANISSQESKARQELSGLTALSGTHSNRQLKEVMTDFWNNHFNVYSYKRGVPALIVVDNKFVRFNALGDFSQLIKVVTRSPSMLTYLDNHTSRADGDNVPNENYARELMELHTLGVDAGYNEQDVKSLSYLLSGWGVGDDKKFKFTNSYNRFDDHLKNGGDIMGWTPPYDEGSRQNITSFFSFLANHTATSLYICWKLCRYFISDDVQPSDYIVKRTAREFRANNTAIVPTLRKLFASGQFYKSKGKKVKRSNELLYSILRTTDVTVNLENPTGLGNTFRVNMADLGVEPFGCEPPTGYTNIASEFINSNEMISRWNLGFEIVNNSLSGRIRVSTSDWPDSASTVAGFVNLLSHRLMGRTLEARERLAIFNHLGKAGTDPTTNAVRAQIKTVAALIFASTSFQVR